MKLILALFLSLSCLTLGVASVNPMDGLWVAVNPHGDLTKLSVIKVNGDLLLQAWNLNRPWGPMPVTFYLTNDGGSLAHAALAIWDKPKNRIVLTLKLSGDGNNLRVEEFTNFKGNTSGPNVVKEVDFVRPNKY